MRNVFRKERSDEMYVVLSDERLVLLEDILTAYELLIGLKQAKSKLKVGEWFHIDRKVIANMKYVIHYKCLNAGEEGLEFWQRFEGSNQIADENSEQYPRLIDTLIIGDQNYKDIRDAKHRCEELGEGMCDEVICDLELQMRICNGESVEDLFKKPDKLPNVRIIEFRNGDTGYFGGGTSSDDDEPPAYLEVARTNSDVRFCRYTPYAFRRVTL